MLIFSESKYSITPVTIVVEDTILITHFLLLTILEADEPWWKYFGNEPIQAVYILVCGAPFIIGPIWFVIMMFKTVATNVKTIDLPNAQSFDPSQSREERHARLTRSIAPPQEINFNHGELTVDEVGRSGILGFLDAFEKSVIRSPHPDITLAALKNGSMARDSFVVVYRASPTVRFVAWLTITPTGQTVQWRMKGGELRPIRSPQAGDSHFNYSHDHEKTWYNATFKRKDGESGLDLAFDVVTGNVLDASIASNATWFRGYLTNRFKDALSTVEKDLIQVHGTAALLEQPTERY